MPLKLKKSSKKSKKGAPEEKKGAHDVEKIKAAVKAEADAVRKAAVKAKDEAPRKKSSAKKRDSRSKKVETAGPGLETMEQADLKWKKQYFQANVTCKPVGCSGLVKSVLEKTFPEAKEINVSSGVVGADMNLPSDVADRYLAQRQMKVMGCPIEILPMNREEAAQGRKKVYVFLKKRPWSSTLLGKIFSDAFRLPCKEAVKISGFQATVRFQSQSLYEKALAQKKVEHLGQEVTISEAP